MCLYRDFVMVLKLGYGWTLKVIRAAKKLKIHRVQSIEINL